MGESKKTFFLGEESGWFRGKGTRCILQETEGLRKKRKSSVGEKKAGSMPVQKKEELDLSRLREI